MKRSWRGMSFRNFLSTIINLACMAIDRQKKEVSPRMPPEKLLASVGDSYTCTSVCPVESLGKTIGQIKEDVGAYFSSKIDGNKVKNSLLIIRRGKKWKTPSDSFVIDACVSSILFVTPKSQ